MDNFIKGMMVALAGLWVWGKLKDMEETLLFIKDNARLDGGSPTVYLIPSSIGQTTAFPSTGGTSYLYPNSTGVSNQPTPITQTPTPITPPTTSITPIPTKLSNPPDLFDNRE